MQVSIHNSPVKNVLDALYLDCRTNDPVRRQNIVDVEGTNFEKFKARSTIYMPVAPKFGELMYSLIRTHKSKNIVEFGTSFGVSTIYLASGVRDNGGGTVVTCEFIPEKTQKAKQNLTEAGLSEFVDFRVGDALEVFQKLPSGGIDFVLLDGAKDMYLDVFKMLEPHLNSGAVVAADNTDTEGSQTYLDYVRELKSFVSTPVLIPQGERKSAHEITIKC